MIKETGGDAIFVKTDVTRTEDIKNLIQTTIANYKKLNVLFNNAGIGPSELILESTEETFDKMMAINVKGTWLGMKYAVPEMIKAGGGSIINHSSIAAESAQKGVAIYSATKAAILGMTWVAAIEFAPYNIRVNAIKPGVVATPLSLDAHPPEDIKSIESNIPQRRLQTMEEIAYGALFLASDESSGMTGSRLTIDGGIEANSQLY
jgi:NAD(P)-dependent dehydrogenase (short-subunit alcohol dehydrogenase family)